MEWVTRRRWRVAMAGAATLLALSAVDAQAGICLAGPQTVTTTVVVTQSCTVTGDLVIASGGTVFFNYRGSPQNRLFIMGNLAVKGTGRFYLAGGVLEFQQSFRQHREIRTTGQARLVVSDAKIVTSQNTEPKFMYYFVDGFSRADFSHTRLDPVTSWLIAQVQDSAEVSVLGSQLVPTEVYVRNKSSVSIKYSSGVTCWMELDNGSSGRIELPVQVDANNRPVPYDFRWGRESPVVSGIGWQVEIIASNVELGAESSPGSSFRIVGVGRPSSGELRVSYTITGGTHILSELATGLVNIVMDGGRLILENVQLGLISWQIYVRDADVIIRNSVVNEVGVDANARVRVENSVLQLAAVASLGSGSVLEIYGSQMYSQAADIRGNGRLVVENSAIHGTSFRTYHALGVVQITNGSFLANASDCNFQTIFDGLGGVPRCNPFIPPGAAPTKSGPGTTTCLGTVDCAW